MHVLLSRNNYFAERYLVHFCSSSLLLLHFIFGNRNLERVFVYVAKSSAVQCRFGMLINKIIINSEGPPLTIANPKLDVIRNLGS